MKKPELIKGRCSICGTVPIYNPKARISFCKCEGIVWAGNWVPPEFDDEASRTA